jgi:hypothetical protein
VDNFEIVFKNFNKEKLDNFIELELLNAKNKLRYSNFFDNIKKKDLTIENISSVSNILSPRGCGSISFSEFKFRVYLENTVVTFSFDENFGDIVVNFEMKTFLEKREYEIIKTCRKIVKISLRLKKMYSIPIILIGFEPAEDEDTCLLRLSTDDINLTEATENLSSLLLKHVNMK